MDPRDLVILISGLLRTLEQDQDIPLNDTIRPAADSIDQMSDNVRITPQIADELLLARVKVQVGEPLVALERLEKLLLARHVWSTANNQDGD